MREPGAAAEAPRRKVQGGLCDSRVEGQSEWGEGGQHPKRRRCIGTRQQMWVSTQEAVTTDLVSSKGRTVISQKPILLQCARWRGEESNAEGTASRPLNAAFSCVSALLGHWQPLYWAPLFTPEVRVSQVRTSDPRAFHPETHGR